MPFFFSTTRNNDDVFQLINKRKWKKIRHLLNNSSNPSDILSSYPEKALGQNALHALCRQDPPIDLIKKFIEISPTYPVEVDYHGRMPLHIAADSSAAPDIIELLAAVYPEAASVKDREGKTPLMLACNTLLISYSQCPSMLDDINAAEDIWSLHVIRVLVYASPQTASDEDKSGISALEYAISNEAPQYIIRALQHACKNACLRKKAETQGEIFKFKNEKIMHVTRSSPQSMSCGIPLEIDLSRGSFFDSRISTISC